jgi:uncharacterized membrane protein
MKNILALILILLFTVVIVMLSACHLTKHTDDNTHAVKITQAQQICIERIIATDSSLGTIRNNASRSTTLLTLKYNSVFSLSLLVLGKASA